MSTLIPPNLSMGATGNEPEYLSYVESSEGWIPTNLEAGPPVLDETTVLSTTVIPGTNILYA